MRFPHLEIFYQRGKRRCYVRNRHGKKRIAITAEPNTPEFIAEYQSAVAKLGLPLTRRHVAHLPAQDEWHHWQITRHEPRERWRREQRTKCVADYPTTEPTITQKRKSNDKSARYFGDGGRGRSRGTK